MAGTLNKLNSVIDYNGHSMIGMEAPTYVDYVVLAASTNINHTVPTGAKFVIFSATKDFYVKMGGNATYSASASTVAGDGSYLNPNLLDITGQTTIGIISDTASAVVTMAFYK